MLLNGTWAVVVKGEEDGRTNVLGYIEIAQVGGRLTVKHAPSDHAGHIADLVGRPGATISRTRLNKLVAEGTLVSPQYVGQ